MGSKSPCIKYNRKIVYCINLNHFIPEQFSGSCERPMYRGPPPLEKDCSVPDVPGSDKTCVAGMIYPSGMSQDFCLYLQKSMINFRVPLKPKSDIHCNRSATSPRSKFKTIAEVAEESQLGFAVGRRLVGDWSATNRGLVAD